MHLIQVHRVQSKIDDTYVRIQSRPQRPQRFCPCAPKEVDNPTFENALLDWIMYSEGGFERNIFVDSLYSILLSTLIMASLYELRELPIEGDYFLSFDDLLEVIRDASVKQKFSFKTPHKDLKRARYRCANKECP